MLRDGLSDPGWDGLSDCTHTTTKNNTQGWDEPENPDINHAPPEAPPCEGLSFTTSLILIVAKQHARGSTGAMSLFNQFQPPLYTLETFVETIHAPGKRGVLLFQMAKTVFDFPHVLAHTIHRGVKMPQMLQNNVFYVDHGFIVASVGWDEQVAM